MTQVSVEDVTADLLRQWKHDPYNLLQILIGVQQAFHHISAAAVDLIADKLSLTRANIEGITSLTRCQGAVNLPGCWRSGWVLNPGRPGQMVW